MMFIEHQMNPRQSRESVVIKANDRDVTVAKLGLDVVGIRVHRFGLEPTFLYMTEKAYYMLRVAMDYFEDVEPGMHNIYYVQEKWFDGDYHMPKQYVKED